MISVSIGVLQASTIQFNPPLPASKTNAINAIGFGNFEKLFVTFKSSFWNANSSTIHFVCTQQPCRYVEAWVVPNTNGVPMLIFWIGGDLAKQITSWTLAQIQADLAATLAKFIKPAPVITNIFISNWTNDPYVRGSYTYAKVGTTSQHFQTLS
jgi:monoamine oxidase